MSKKSKPKEKRLSRDEKLRNEYDRLKAVRNDAGICKYSDEYIESELAEQFNISISTTVKIINGWGKYNDQAKTNGYKS